MPLKNPFRTGDKVLASRLENGEDHELGTVIDSYELLIGAESKPMVVVEFEDGERRYLVAGPPNVHPAPAAEDDEVEEPAEEDAAAAEAAPEGAVEVEPAVEASAEAAGAADGAES